MLAVLGFLNYLPYSKHLHVLTSIPNVYLSNLGPRGALKPLNLADETLPHYGVVDIEDMTWKQLHELAKQGVTIGIHGADYEHMVGMSREDVLSSINRAASRFREELGFTPQYFAYPYGEYNLDLKALVKSRPEPGIWMAI